MLSHDILVDIHFYETSSGGRNSPITAPQFGCVLRIDNKNYDCRLFLQEIGIVNPGEVKKNIPLKFLSPELAMPYLKVGNSFNLWDMRDIASGIIIEIKKNT